MGLTLRLLVLAALLAVSVAWRPAPSRGLAVQIPQVPEVCVDSVIYTRLRVRADGLVEVDARTQTLAQLPAALAALYAGRAERVLFLSAEPAATMQFVTKTIDIAAAQIEVIALVPPSLATATCLTVRPPARAT